MSYDRSQTSKGIAVLTERMDSVRSVAVGIWIAAGARDEHHDEAGISHFLEHMMFKGTPTRTAAQISEAFDRIGAEVNAFTSKEYTCYYFRCIDEHLADGFQVMSEMITSSLMAEEAVQSERAVVLEEISRRDDAPDDLVHDEFAAAMWPKHPLGRAVLGRRETVASFTPQQVRDYVARRYGSDNIVVAAAGRVDHDEMLALVETHLPCVALERGDRGVHAPQVSTKTRVVTKDTEQLHICLGVPGLPAGHPDRFALGLVDTVLGGGMSSRLFQEIREKRGLAYAVFSYHAQYLDAGSYVVYAGTGPDNAEQVVRLIREEIARLLESGVTEEELSRAKESIKGGLLLGLESTNTHMSRLGKNEVTHGEQLSVDEVVERIESVTVDDALRVARDALAGPQVLTVVGPRKKDEIEGLLH